MKHDDDVDVDDDDDVEDERDDVFFASTHVSRRQITAGNKHSITRRKTCTTLRGLQRADVTPHSECTIICTVIRTRTTIFVPINCCHKLTSYTVAGEQKQVQISSETGLPSVCDFKRDTGSCCCLSAHLRIVSSPSTLVLEFI